MLGMLLEEDFVLCHPIVIGELSMGDLKERRSLLLHLSRLNRPRTATWRETREFVEKRELYGRGVQWNDVQLLASCVLEPGCKLWTRDVRLAVMAEDCGVEYSL